LLVLQLLVQLANVGLKLALLVLLMDQFDFLYLLELALEAVAFILKIFNLRLELLVGLKQLLRVLTRRFIRLFQFFYFLFQILGGLISLELQVVLFNFKLLQHCLLLVQLALELLDLVVVLLIAEILLPDLLINDCLLLEVLCLELCQLTLGTLHAGGQLVDLALLFLDEIMSLQQKHLRLGILLILALGHFTLLLYQLLASSQLLRRCV